MISGCVSSITLVKDIKFASTSLLQYTEANLATFTYVVKTVNFASPYCNPNEIKLFVCLMTRGGISIQTINMKKLIL